MPKDMTTLWKGVVAAVDWTKKRLWVRCAAPDDAGAVEPEVHVLSWNVATRVTTPDRGMIPIQQLQVGQRIDADCVRDQGGCWLARAIEVLPAPGSQGIGAKASIQPVRQS
jgi:hypothetical protein